MKVKTEKLVQKIKAIAGFITVIANTIISIVKLISELLK